MKKTYGSLAVLVVLAGLVIGYLYYTKVPSISGDIAEIKVEYIKDYTADETEIAKAVSIMEKEEIEEIQKYFNDYGLRRSPFSKTGFEKSGEILECVRVIFWAEDSFVLELFKDGTIVVNGTVCHGSASSGNKTELYNYFKEKIIAAEEMAHAVDFYIRAGESEEAAREKAEKHMKERDELYQEAIEAGYTVTDEEVWEYLEELKKTIETADNKEDVLAEIARFPSEEDYWEFEFHVYQKNLPIQKYREAGEKK